MKTLVMIDDDSFFLEQYTDYFKSLYKVYTASDSGRGMALVKKCKPDVVLLDIRLKGDNEGLDTLREIKQTFPDIICIMVTNLDSHSIYMEALNRGADDFFIKSDNVDILQEKITCLLESHKRLPAAQTPFVAVSDKTRQLFKLAATASRSVSNVVIYGETGTGKEVVARFIHENSNRSNKPFVAVNCAAIQDGLFESAFFGHEKGSFTGAIKQHKGFLEEAHGGTLFLDELEDLSPRGQGALLRVIQEKTFERVGSTTSLTADVRFIVALKTDLRQLVDQGRFREDLYYRLAVFTLQTPPLRERREDILPLIRFYLKELNAGNKQLSKSSENIVLSYAWKGNLRELRNVIERAAHMAPGSMIHPQHLSLNASDGFSESYKEARERHLQEFREKYYSEALLRNNGNVSKTAEEIGVSRQTLQNFLAGLKSSK